MAMDRPIPKVMFVIRQSKFRHVYAQCGKKDKCYENLRISKNAHDSSFCAVNPKFLAYVTESQGGGTFVVLPLNKTGRLDTDYPKISGHSRPVLDIKFNPFNDNIIASCSDDTTIKLWYIPDGGLRHTLTEPVADLKYHQRRVAHVEWHSVASGILASAGYDMKVIIWNVEEGRPLTIIEGHPDTIYSMAWSRDGEMMVTTCKDKQMRIFNTRNGELITQGQCHEGAKASKVTFMSDKNRLLTTGFSKSSERQYAIWDQNNLEKPLKLEVLDSSSGVLFPFYDFDTGVFFLAGKGDGNVRFFETVPDKPYSHYISEYKSPSPQRGLGWMCKRGVDVSYCEISRFYKLHSTKPLCEPISMIVPRRSDLFQTDLYPDTLSYEPTLSADEWSTGVSRELKLMKIGDDYEPPSTGYEFKAVSSPPRRQSSISCSPLRAQFSAPLMSNGVWGSGSWASTGPVRTDSVDSAVNISSVSSLNMRRRFTVGEINTDEVLEAENKQLKELVCEKDEKIKHLTGQIRVLKSQMKLLERRGI